MSRHLVSLMTTAAMAVGALLMAASPVPARGGGGGHGGGFSRGYAGGYYGRGYYGGGYGRGYYGGGYSGGYYGRGYYGAGYGRGYYGGGYAGGYYGRGYYGAGYGRGYYGRGYYGGAYGGGDYGQGYYGGGYGGGYYGNGAGFSYSSGSSGYLPSYVADTAPTMSGYYSPPAVGASSKAVPPSYDTASADASAHIRMEVPAGAEIWIDGAKTLQTGNVRNFVSPPLSPARSYSYEVSCRWPADGRPVEVTRQVSVRANAWTTVDFTRSDTGPETIPAPKAVRALPRDR